MENCHYEFCQLHHYQRLRIFSERCCKFNTGEIIAQHFQQTFESLFMGSTSLYKGNNDTFHYSDLLGGSH